MTASAATVALLSACAFAGNVGAAVTGFGQAIIFLFVWQIVELAGYDETGFKYAVFIQALSLFSMQPLLLYKAQVLKHAHRRILLLFVPITLVSTPLGQLVSDKVPTKIVQAVAGALVTFVACFEIYCKRKWFGSVCDRCRTGEGETGAKAAGDAKLEAVEEGNGGGDAEAQKMEETAKDDDFEENALESGEPSGNNADATATNDATIEESNAAESLRDTNAQSNSNPPKEPFEQLKIGANPATFWTLLAGGASGFLGGMVAIRGPPLIFYFLHPPRPVSFDKISQRATGVAIMCCNVVMRQIFYLVNTFTDSGRMGYEKENWRLYLSVIVCSIAGGYAGSTLFQYVKDSKDTIRGVLAVFLFLCGISLLISAFG
ncbi:hypothetical protein ACHAXT_006056 [Thalassiosira profunda]